MPFGDFIRQKREEAEIPLNDFARRIGISPAYWSRIERNMEKPPKDDLITKAAQELHLDLDEVFVQANRLPPELQKNLGDVVLAYRKRPKIEG
ncbi:MAG: helix-turn-helix transcriptional regulator [Candidatus Accumulibacter sp.]|jgi:transcriptional regulator with XRE-family HTH domain|uniref:helix-turn-helix domain-containing protein n=1 Tax=Accumulibacter sp. TaxID=2053492 RepID=UPI00258B4AB5|nr:helix-turn-helix transcriptional regulator [Accumulibacter sp.]MCM8621467.1 helix-turn-helix transcriptional regulator [Accumulibacter sp.]